MAKLVLGCGESTIQVVREGDNDPENWTIARVLMHDRVHESIEVSEVPGERWCALVEDVAEEALDADPAVIAYRTVDDFNTALRVCTGFDPRDPALRNQAIATLRAEREAPCSHPAEMRQPRLPIGSRCGACDETFS